jgi:hypothetical protein
MPNLGGGFDVPVRRDRERRSLTESYLYGIRFNVTIYSGLQ